MRRLAQALALLADHGDVLVDVQPAEDGGSCLFTDRAGHRFRIVFSWGLNWDHVSVSCADERTPTWAEMEVVKRAFFKDGETAMQLHVPRDDHIDCHPYCLHLWRPQRVKIPRPPGDMVAPKNVRVRRVG